MVVIERKRVRGIASKKRCEMLKRKLRNLSIINRKYKKNEVKYGIIGVI